MRSGMDGWTDGRTDGRTDRHMDGRTDPPTNQPKWRIFARTRLKIVVNLGFGVYTICGTSPSSCIRSSGRHIPAHHEGHGMQLESFATILYTQVLSYVNEEAQWNIFYLLQLLKEEKGCNFSPEMTSKEIKRGQADEEKPLGRSFSAHLSGNLWPISGRFIDVPEDGLVVLF